MQKNRLDYLIDKFHSGSITAKEHDELLELLAEESNQDTAEDFFHKSWNNFEPQENLDLNFQISPEIKEIFDQKTNNKRKNIIYRYIGTAVAASLTLFCLFYFLFIHKPNNTAQITNNSRVLTDLEPGKDRATLTLSNNQKITLEGDISGIITETEGLIIKKNKNNEILIEVKPIEAKSELINELNTISTPKGGQFTVILPDKSKVYLNAETSLTFPSEFASNERVVSLDGEAFFEIAKSKTKPFFVKTEAMTIEVLGTHFNVNSYNSDQLKSTTLVEGSIKIYTATNSKLMIPGQKADIRKGTTSIQIQTVDIEEAIAWKNGYFLFIDKDLKTIMKYLSRWYNFDIKFGESFVNETFTGTVSRNQNISEILKIFEKSGSTKLKILSQGNSDNERRTIIMN